MRTKYVVGYCPTGSLLYYAKDEYWRLDSRQSCASWQSVRGWNIYVHLYNRVISNPQVERRSTSMLTLHRQQQHSSFRSRVGMQLHTAPHHCTHQLYNCDLRMDLNG